MGVLELQALILVTIILSAILGGKKGGIIASGVWLFTTIIIMYSDIFAGIQLITIALSFEISLLIGIGRDYYMKRKNIKLQSIIVKNKE